MQLVFKQRLGKNFPVEKNRHAKLKNGVFDVVRAEELSSRQLNWRVQLSEVVGW
jgi:hypothetical protein